MVESSYVKLGDDENDRKAGWKRSLSDSACLNWGLELSKKAAHRAGSWCQHSLAHSICVGRIFRFRWETSGSPCGLRCLKSIALRRLQQNHVTGRYQNISYLVTLEHASGATTLRHPRSHITVQQLHRVGEGWC
jgi:hypothetical protein